jgi:hypothetical protein
MTDKIQSNKILPKILLLSAIIMMMLTATIPLSHIFFMQIVVAQNVTASNVMDNTNVNATNKNFKELALQPLKIIVKLEDPSEAAGMGIIASDPLSIVTNDIEERGLEANITSVSPGRNTGSTVFMELTPSADPDSPFAGALAAGDINKITETTLQILEQNPLVEFAQFDMAMEIPRPVTGANISTTSNQQITPTGIDRVDSEIPLSQIDPVNADIAIIDTGTMKEHPDLNVYRQAFFIGTGPEDNCGHGTHVAGIAAAKNNDEGVVSAAPDARIWSLKVMEDPDFSNPNDRCGTQSLQPILDALDYVIDHADEIDVVNLSLGGICPIFFADCRNPVYEDRINQVIDSGVTVVVAAGNDRMDATHVIPARFQNVITVSAITDSDAKCGGQGSSIFGDRDDTFATAYSNFGIPIDIAGPGTQILSTWNDGKYKTIDGTSMAAPHIAGVAAVYKSLNPEASPSDVYNAVLAAATTSKDNCDGKGKGYFGNDVDGINEPLLYGGNLSAFQQRELTSTLPQ